MIIAFIRLGFGGGASKVAKGNKAWPKNRDVAYDQKNLVHLWISIRDTYALQVVTQLGKDLLEFVFQLSFYPLYTADLVKSGIMWRLLSFLLYADSLHLNTPFDKKDLEIQATLLLRNACLVSFEKPQLAEKEDDIEVLVKFSKAVRNLLGLRLMEPILHTYPVKWVDRLQYGISPEDAEASVAPFLEGTPYVF